MAETNLSRETDRLSREKPLQHMLNIWKLTSKKQIIQEAWKAENWSKEFLKILLRVLTQQFSLDSGHLANL